MMKAKPKILLVEDNPENRYLTTFLLEQAGYDVVVATNGRHALALAPEAAPDLVLMDIEMPEIDGYEAARRLKADERLAHVPIVGVSSFAMPHDRAKALACGFAGYYEKPIDPESFAQEIAAFLPLALRP
jgi:two-component system, cell cycle response regulator DivK